MRRFPEPNFSRRAAKTKRRSFWQHPGFCLASLPLYIMPFCEYLRMCVDCPLPLNG
jgi:hypothetical protein